MKNYFSLFSIFAILSFGCASINHRAVNHSKPPAPIIVSNDLTKSPLVAVGQLPNYGSVIVSFVGTQSILIQGKVNITDTNWFNIIQSISTNGSVAVPMNYSTEFFRGIGLTYITWAYPFSNSYSGFKVFYGTNSAVNLGSFDVKTNQSILITNFNTFAPMYFSVCAYLNGTNGTLSTPVIKTNYPITVSIFATWPNGSIPLINNTTNLLKSINSTNIGIYSISANAVNVGSWDSTQTNVDLYGGDYEPVTTTLGADFPYVGVISSYLTNAISTNINYSVILSTLIPTGSTKCYLYDTGFIFLNK